MRNLIARSVNSAQAQRDCYGIGKIEINYFQEVFLLMMVKCA